MNIAYLDTSAAMKLIVSEPESGALGEELDSDPSRVIAASWLLHTELHCAAARHPESVARDAVNDVLSRLTLIDLTRGDLMSAGALPALRSHDAIHLAVALRIGASQMIAYDTELIKASRQMSLGVLSPP